MKKSLVAVFSTVCLAGAMMVTAIAAPENVSASYATKALENAVSNGLLQGNNESGDLNPQGNLTRAEMAAVINRAFNAKESTSIMKFTDVSNTAWYYNDMAKAVRMGTFVGEGTTLSPERNISREEAFAVVARAFKLQGQNSLASSSYLSANQVSSWARGQVYAMINNGYVTGDGVSIDPQAYITRQDFAVIFDRMVNQYIKVQGTVTSITGNNVMVNVPGVTLKDVTIQGNLIIGDGVGSGSVTLDNVKVNGRILVRGGGALVIQGASVINRIDVAIPAGNNNVFIDVKDGVSIPGKINILENENAVKLNGVTVNNVNTPEGTPTATVTTNVPVTGNGGGGGGHSSGGSSSTNQIALTSFTLNSTTPMVGDTLTANVTPSGASVRFDWYVDGQLVITNHTASYKVQTIDYGKVITVNAVAYGDYKGTVTVATDKVGMAANTESPVKIVVNGVTKDVTSQAIQMTSAELATLTQVSVKFDEAVTLVYGADRNVIVTTIPAGNTFNAGIVAIDPTDTTKVILDMNDATKAMAIGKTGTFKITVPSGVIKDAAGKLNQAYVITITLQ